MIKNILCIIFILFKNVCFSQNYNELNCNYKINHEKDSRILERFSSYQKKLAGNRGNNIIQIPTIFHIANDKNNTEGVKFSLIAQAVLRANDLLSSKGSPFPEDTNIMKEFQNDFTDTKIRICLMKPSFYQQVEVSSSTKRFNLPYELISYDENLILDTSNHSNFLNIWVSDSSVASGRGFFPGKYLDNNFISIETPDNYSLQEMLTYGNQLKEWYNYRKMGIWLNKFDGIEGDVLAHELGHVLGLFHNFENSCEGHGDYIDSTPAEDRKPYKRNEIYNKVKAGELVNTCPKEISDRNDQYTNVMDYTFKMKGFNNEQGLIMQQTLLNDYQHNPSEEYTNTICYTDEELEDIIISYDSNTENLSLNAFPNPIQSNAQITITIPFTWIGTKNLQLSLISLDGKILKKFPINNLNSPSIILKNDFYDFLGLPSGIYLLSVYNPVTHQNAISKISIFD